MKKIDQSIRRGHWQGQQFVYYRTPRERLRDATTGRLWPWLRTGKPDTRYPVQEGPGTRETNPHWPWWRQSYATGNNHGEGWAIDPTFRGAVTEPPGWWNSPFNPRHPHLLDATNWIARWVFRRKPLRVEPLDGTMTSVTVDRDSLALFHWIDHPERNAL